MPTPESAAFLAKKPTVAPTFDGVDYDDNKALKQAQDAIIREQWVQVMMGRLVREELSKCYYKEGVNHLEKCGHLRGQSCRGKRTVLESVSRKRPLAGKDSTERYLDILGKAKVRGYLFEQQNYIKKSE
ncbi:hypothetical protein N0V82_000508 [Gnomoniopsis sp. IMI 355080]|nr:hypothetical protein N0V82_000508 [Gnomoniopsis sp. IMI 355080]